MANADTHAALIRAADSARLVVFPELSLTGYALDAQRIDLQAAVLAPLVEACQSTGATALVGAPAGEGGTSHIATLAVTGRGVVVAYKKMFLGPEEETVFTPGDAPAVLDIDGWRVGLGICKDTRIVEQIDGTLALGIDLYAAGLVHHPHELAEQDARAARIIECGGTPVAFASAAGWAGSDYPTTAGHSSIWAGDGSVLARASAAPGEVAIAVLRREDVSRRSGSPLL